MPGVPASVTRATSSPPARARRIPAAAPAPEWAWKEIIRGREAPRWVSKVLLRRVSSAATTGTTRSSSAARAVRSPRWPSGVATTYRVPRRTSCRGELIRARPRAEVLGDPRLEGGLLGQPDDRVHVLAVLEEQQRGDRADVEAHRGLLVLIHVHLGHSHPALVAGGELLQDRRDGAAGTAPFGPEIHDRKAAALLHLGREVVVGQVGDGSVLTHSHTCSCYLEIGRAHV